MRLKVGPFDVKVKFLDILPTAAGATWSEDGVIHVSKDQNLQHQQETTLHELMHMIVDETDLRALDKDDIEKMISALSPRLFALVRDNPKFVKWLCL